MARTHPREAVVAGRRPQHCPHVVEQEYRRVVRGHEAGTHAPREVDEMLDRMHCEPAPGARVLCSRFFEASKEDAKGAAALT